MYQTGTHGSVGGRLANQSSASYPIRYTWHIPMEKTPFFLASLRKTVYHVGRRKEALAHEGHHMHR